MGYLTALFSMEGYGLPVRSELNAVLLDADYPGWEVRVDGVEIWLQTLQKPFQVGQARRAARLGRAALAGKDPIRSGRLPARP